MTGVAVAVGGERYAESGKPPCRHVRTLGHIRRRSKSSRPTGYARPGVLVRGGPTYHPRVNSQCGCGGRHRTLRVRPAHVPDPRPPRHFPEKARNPDYFQHEHINRFTKLHTFGGEGHVRRGGPLRADGIAPR